MNYSITLSDLFFRHSVDIDYDYDRSRCDCTDMCRCGVVTDSRIRSIPMEDAVGMVDIREAYKDKRGANRKRAYKLSKVEQYCIDRLTRIHKLYDSDLYTVKVVGGYYGEEIDGVELDGVVAKKFLDSVSTMMAAPDDISKIKFILKEEYAFVLDLIKGTNAVRIVTIDGYEELLKNPDYALRIKNSDIGSYVMDESLPRGIIHDGRLIDGYHRMASWGDGGSVDLIELVTE